MIWYGTVWYGMVWYGMVWYGMVWYGMVWFDFVQNQTGPNIRRVGTAGLHDESVDCLKYWKRELRENRLNHN